MSLGPVRPRSRELTAILACGCFWGVQQSFSRVRGVRKVECGYTGGHIQYPSYRSVCSGVTGHLEAVRISYDPKVTTYRALLDEFWRLHDPTVDHCPPEKRLADGVARGVASDAPDQSVVGQYTDFVAATPGLRRFRGGCAAGLERGFGEE